MRVLSDQVAASLLSAGVEELAELFAEGVGGWPSEVVGDGDGEGASAEADGPDPLGGSAVGTDVGVGDLDGDGLPAGRSVAGTAGG
jgi:hypothetical protein